MGIKKLYLLVELSDGNIYQIEAFTPEIYPILENIIIDKEIRIYKEKLDIKLFIHKPNVLEQRVKEINNTGVYEFYCEGCQEVHFLHTRNNKQLWVFNKDVNFPTFYPSLIWKNKKGEQCHSIIEDGWIKYHNNSEHKLAGKKQPITKIL